MINYYRILGVSRDDGAERIRSRFRELSKTAHPDRGGDNDRYVLVLEAYHTLTDPEARKDYDRRLALMSASPTARPATENEITAELYVTAAESITGCTREIEYGKSVVVVDVPKGVMDGQELVFRNHNGLGLDVKANVHIVTPPSCELRRYRGRYEIVYRLYMAKCMLGRRIRISPLGESLLITIPADTRSGRMFKLKGKGYPLSGTVRSDLYVKVVVTE